MPSYNYYEDNSLKREQQQQKFLNKLKCLKWPYRYDYETLTLYTVFIEHSFVGYLGHKIFFPSHGYAWTANNSG